MDTERPPVGEEEKKEGLLKGDKYIWGIYFILCFISIIEIYSATSTLTFKEQDYFAPTIRHCIFLLLGTTLVVAIHNIPIKYFKLIPIFLIPVSGLLLVYTMFFGKTINGAQRVIQLFGFTVQPSELAKLGVITAVAFILARSQRPDGVSKDAFKNILWIVTPACLLILPENFSTAFLLGVVCFCMMIIGRIEWKKIALLVGIAIVFLSIIFLVIPRMPEGIPGMDRAQTWINRMAHFTGEDGVPAYEEPTVDENYQVHHARMAVANGGVFGLFPGNSIERDFLPQAFSDFIYAIIIEEMGYIGGIVVMLLYLWLLVRAGIIAKRCTRASPAFLIMGCTLIIVFQAIMHMAVSVGLMPVTGQPLPLISRGGTSTLITCVYFGIILSVSHYGVMPVTETKEAEEPEEAEGQKIEENTYYEGETPVAEDIRTRDVFY